MPRIPLEDTYVDVMRKALAASGADIAEIARRAEVTQEDAEKVLAGDFNDAVVRRLARHLRLHPDALCELARDEWYPKSPAFPTGFAAFSTAYKDMRVNSYLIWDERSRQAAAFDTGTDCSEMLDTLTSLRARLSYIFLTHTHPDHIAELGRLVAATGAEVWASEREPAPFEGARTFSPNAFFHIGPLSIKCMPTPGHTAGGTSYHVSNLSYPLVIAGDAIFSGSMGRSQTTLREAVTAINTHILSQTLDTVIACGHGPLTTVRQERKHNPFFARR
ncbi:MBL fold metallo-hydrolase [Nibricoccus sp. IMCC34717]|uniref:MBL fold metallo-hydrolase n=1 Tax=Nibricoccus sp. IMCC34717 TaxID=3034021 RepID=UPI00384D484B